MCPVSSNTFRTRGQSSTWLLLHGFNVALFERIAQDTDEEYPMADGPHDEFDHLTAVAEALGLSADAPPVERRMVRGPNGAMSALVWGSSPPELTVLHGGALNAHSWDSTLLALGRPALSIDLPGHGFSDWRDDADYSPPTNARSVARVIDELGNGAPRPVVGQSLGGLTAIALAGARLDLVSHLVLVDISPSLKPAAGNPVRGFLGGPRVFASRDEIVDRAVAFGIGSSREALRRGVIHNTRILDTGGVVFRHHLAHLPPDTLSVSWHSEELWRDLENAGVPVLLVHGTRGFLSPELVEEFLDRIPASHALAIEAGHNVQQHAPLQLAEAIADFVD